MKTFLLPRLVILKLINFYQKTLSPDHGFLKARHPYGFCRFYPTCSEYGRQAIEKDGILKGGSRLLRRLLRCNPWSAGGVDEP